MTEPLGVVASGIAVAQLGVATGGAILKLKKLWDQVNDAPETISDLIERLELIYPSVWDFERQCSQSGLPPMLWDSSTAIRSLAYCRKALTKFSNVVDDLSTQITSRRGFRKRLTAFKVVLKKDELRRLEEQLKNSLEVLRFAQEAYTRALLTATPDIITLKVQQYVQCDQTTTLQPIEDKSTSPPDCETKEVHKPSALSRTTGKSNQRAIKAWEPWSSFGTLSIRNGQKDLDVEVRPPWWLAGLASSFSLHVSKYRSSWDIQLRLYSDRPQIDPVFTMAERGDTVGLQSLFDQRKASPFDRDEDGWTLLHWALSRGKVETSMLLIEMGVGLEEKDRWGESWSVFQRIQPVSCPFHQETELSSRLDRLDSLAYAETQVQQFILGSEWSTDPKTVCDEIWANYGFSLLHHIAFPFSRLSDRDESEATRLHEFAKKAMLTTDLYPLVLGSYWAGACEMVETDITPLIRLILVSLDRVFSNRFRKVQEVNTTLQAWIGDLIAIGIDIEEYGREEYDILRNTDSMSSMSIKAGRYTLVDSDYPLRGYVIHLYGFTYGPSVEDWTILINEPTDEFAGEFWDFVEERPLDMPGAWFD
ncbi:uncharacterized protein PG998_004324 [Apiospora kogelbergensis]|uniref:uncharacterized protein n=1 Tax=Apiospora kogelbergensis TaxID=1337665 RepID=UPI00312F6604